MAAASGNSRLVENNAREFTRIREHLLLSVDQIYVVMTNVWHPPNLININGVGASFISSLQTVRTISFRSRIRPTQLVGGVNR